MKLDKLEYPFSDFYDSGYVYISNEGRRIITFIKDKKSVAGMAYARYLMSVKLGRFLSKDETVDHIDENKLNDKIENLQILSREENFNKYNQSIPHGIHGTNSMYRSGCRCGLCRKWKSNYQQNYLNNHPEKNIEKVCEYCKKIFYVNLNHKDQRFCSQACSSKNRTYKNKT